MESGCYCFVVLLLLCGTRAWAHSDECQPYRGCVSCHFYNSGTLTEKQCKACGDRIIFEQVDDLDVTEYMPCLTLDPTTACIEKFIVIESKDNTKVKIQSTGQCSTMQTDNFGATGLPSSWDYDTTYEYKGRRGDSLPDVQDSTTKRVTEKAASVQGGDSSGNRTQINILCLLLSLFFAINRVGF